MIGLQLLHISVQALDPLRYKDLLRKDGSLKADKEIQSQQILLNGWDRMQLESRFVKDTVQGFYLQQTEFDRLQLESHDKLI